MAARDAQHEMGKSWDAMAHRSLVGDRRRDSRPPRSAHPHMGRRPTAPGRLDGADDPRPLKALLLPLTAFTLLPSTIIAMGTSASVRFAMNPPALLARDPEYVCVQRGLQHIKAVPATCSGWSSFGPHDRCRTGTGSLNPAIVESSRVAPSQRFRARSSIRRH
jgi:hypothetical protein